EARAERRSEELRAAGEPSIYAEILKDVEDRDQRDSARAEAPLRPAVDALVIDTTCLDADAVYAQVIEKIAELRKGRA
ncbi:MAG TPA: (d)CMP kinase, partial [Alphaproteobacteria bacterium]|nr:(d)CMP kinase [Alphaproteobacteria bacterium]